MACKSQPELSVTTVCYNTCIAEVQLYHTLRMSMAQLEEEEELSSSTGLLLVMT